MKTIIPVICAFLLSFSLMADKKKKNINPRVIIETSHGEIEVELFEKKAPLSVKNFLTYVDSGFYNGTIFHRVIDNFMIQGGGFDRKLQRKTTRPPIKNEATNGLSNETGTIAMARTNVVNSATAQFYINVKDNNFLNHKNTTPRGYGYAVFGRVVKGMPVVNRIKRIKTSAKGQFANFPTQEVFIKKARRK